SDLCWKISADEHSGGKEVDFPESAFLQEFVLENGLPLWRFEKNGIRLEKRVFMPHLQNTTYTSYKLVSGPPGLRLKLRFALHFRPHEGLLTEEVSKKWTLRIENGR